MFRNFINFFFINLERPIKDSLNNYNNLMEKQIEVDQIVSSTVDEALKQLNIE